MRINPANVNRNPMVNSFRDNIQAQREQQRLASGRRINRAEDDAAGLAISEGMSALIRSLDRATDNARDMGNLQRTAEGGLESVSDNLMRMRDLNLQASNGIMTESQRELIQMEVSQLVEQIERVIEDTQFNGIRLLDGSFGERHMASNPDGTGSEINIMESFDPAVTGYTPLQVLGIENFSVVDPAEHQENLRTIDAALGVVNAERAALGAGQNRIDHITTANTQYGSDLAASRSRIADADMAMAAMLHEQQRVLEQYQIASFRMQMDRDRESIGFVGIAL